MKPVWITKKWVVVLVHAACWLVIFSLPFLLRTSYNKAEHRAPDPDDKALSYFYIISCALWIGLFYLNTYALVHSLLHNKKVWRFAALHLLALAVIYCLHWGYFALFVTAHPFKAPAFVVYNIFPYMFILASSTAYAMLLERQRAVKLARQRQTETLQTELLFLRSQVSPHFMFNVLNNMVALARKKSDLLEPSLLKLSSLMRYMLYETDEQRVPLEKEIEYLQSYIDLQQQRFGKNVQVNVSMHDINCSHEIEPMLLIPFVENAFKHGTGLIVNAQINIELKEVNNILQFVVSNKYNNLTHETKDKNSGIGLNNVKRRLNLLYGQNHALLIDKKDGWFTVSLQINLH